MVFACKKCKKCFRKDASEFEESDEYCPHCDNHFVIDALTPKPSLQVEGEDARVDSRYDLRVELEHIRTALTQ
jgi:Zn finger protein HypA/HybF involved in hydrogenase expression